MIERMYDMIITITPEQLQLLRDKDKETKNAPFYEQYKMEHCRIDEKGRWVFVKFDVPTQKTEMTYKKVGRQYYIYNGKNTDRWTATLQVRELLNLI